MEKAGGPSKAAGSVAEKVARLGDLEIYVPIPVDLLAERHIDLRERSVMLLIVPILPVQLIAFHLVGHCSLNGVVVESNQVELWLITLICRLRLSLRWWRVLLLILRLLLGRSRRTRLPLALRRGRIALLITVILLRRRR
jgi:hypothetical protein